MRRELLKPKRLRRGSVVGVAAISGPADPIALELGGGFLERHGFVVRHASNVSFRGGPLSLAGSVEERLSGYLDLLLDPDVDAILFSRGGYGAVDVVSKLDPAIVRANPKLHCGFSDVTVLASFLLERCGIPSIHGPMVAAEMARPFEGLPAQFFPSILMGDSPQELVIEDADILVPGRAEGPLIGGCLSLLASVCGTPEEFSYEGGLLFFEDTGEEAYRIDRMLAQLSRAGRLQKVTGVLVGNLSSVTFGGREDHQRLRSVLVERLSPLGVPVVWGLPAGHRGPNVPLAVGGYAVWDSESRTLKFCEEIVS